MEMDRRKEKMIDIKDKKVREILAEIHQGMKQKIKRGNVENEEIILENRIFNTICQDFEIGPTKCAIELNREYDYSLTGDQVIQVFRSRRMANPIERREILEWASEIASLFAKAMAGDNKSYEKFETLRREAALKNGKKHDSQERIAVIMIYAKFPEIDIYDDSRNLQYLGNTLAKYFFYDLADAVGNIYGFQTFRNEKKKSFNNQDKISHEQALRRVMQLENTLERTNTMLQELQDEFDEQIEASKSKELAEFFSKLNSEKYGCILDELLVVKKGIDELKAHNYELPVEINGLLIMVKKLIQFVRDSHIDPIMKINSTKIVKASDVEFCNYEGTAFKNNDDEKKVKVISPGWVYRDKEIQISRPKVKEEI